MARVERKAAVVAAAGLLCLLAVGCREAQTPDAKQARLIAAENMQLEKDLADRDAQMAKLKADYDKQLRAKDDQLAADRKRIETLQNDVQKAVSERVSQVTAAVMDENAKLRKENEALRAQIEKRKGNGEL